MSIDANFNVIRRGTHKQQPVDQMNINNIQKIDGQEKGREEESNQ